MAEHEVLIVADDETTREGLRALLALHGFSVDTAQHGSQALDAIRRCEIGVVLLDVGFSGVSGVEVMARGVDGRRPANVVVVTPMDTPETVLAALRHHAFDVLPKPIDPARLLDMVRRALAVANPLPIQVLSARPEWLELLVPCTREAVDRIQSFLDQLGADLPGDVRESVGLAVHELLMNGIEWGGHLNPSQTVRVACLRTPRMLLYRIADPGAGFRLEDLSHAEDLSDSAGGGAAAAIAHDQVREAKGLRPGGFGLVLIRSIADELLYNEQRNEVVFVKYLDEPGDGSSGRGDENEALPPN